MVPFLVLLEEPFDPGRDVGVRPVDLVRFALGATDYWAALALDWLEQGVACDAVTTELQRLVDTRTRPQRLRHRAGRLLKQRP
jgi:hypothetical protein